MTLYTYLVEYGILGPNNCRNYRTKLMNLTGPHESEALAKLKQEDLPFIQRQYGNNVDLFIVKITKP